MRVAVIGAGIQGVCTAIELSMRGAEVDLLEVEAQPLTRASLRNEGKIHLGFVYANDPTLATARLMVAGAFCFAPLMERWLGAALQPTLLASPFLYLVRKDSQLGADELERRYRGIAALIDAQTGSSGADYFGCSRPMRAERLSARAQCGIADDAEIAATFRTAELAVDPEALARLLSQRIMGEPRIRLRPHARVLSMHTQADQAMVRCAVDGEIRTLACDHAVNASWEGRLAIDSASGIDLPDEWCFRAKYFLRLRGARGAAAVPSATIVLGPFGDVVRYANGDLFLSWYPAGRTAWSDEAAPPYWPSTLAEPQAATLRQGIRDGLQGIVPALRDLEPDAVAGGEVHGGVIYARGRTDISDPASGLHQRWNIGPRSHGRCHTVDTGKYSVAPLFARQIADTICGASR